ncbi:hypothetical protein H6F42_19345 [Pseudanabaena sp. FACHB-1998]|uniref:hypothetical protein n=1 Tax=Pseudanabaena sp. FACHB-1998 TaxID=2692858 RepID=UPI00168161C1|nr:hypothetical protein [Pseudanabaena sp. FACHB-1998]MBD2179082.1 hypothetical protein [Pseudanabaena sp. FACHB-1998]
MNRHYQYISQFGMAVILAIASTSSPVMAQSTVAAQPRKGDANQLRPAKGQLISPTNIDQFSLRRSLPSSSLKIQNVNLEVGTVEPVLSGNYNASPQKVNKLGNFTSDPLNAVQIFQESTTPRRPR